MAVFVVGVFAYFGVLGAIRLYIGPEIEGAPQPSLTVIVLLSMAVIGEFVIVACVGTASERDKRKYAVTCESCGKRLDVGDLSFATAIHGCPYCQNALFQEWNTRRNVSTSLRPIFLICTEGVHCVD